MSTEEFLNQFPDATRRDKRGTLVHVHRDQVEGWRRIGKEHTELKRENAELRAAVARVEALAESADWCQECAIGPEILAALRGDQ